MSLPGNLDLTGDFRWNLPTPDDLEEKLVCGLLGSFLELQAGSGETLIDRPYSVLILTH